MKSRIESIKTLKEYLRQIEEAKKNSPNHNSQQTSDKGQGVNKTLSKGAHPETGKFFANGNDSKNGYTNFLMLSLITFVFESLFLIISYFIFK